MFDIGFSELFLLSLIGLLVLGPERLPGVARTLGGFVRKARRSWISLRQTIESELTNAEIIDPIKRAGEEFKRLGNDLGEIPGFTLETPTARESPTEPPEAEKTQTAVTAPEPPPQAAPLQPDDKVVKRDD